jgi:alpha,alpha-trehalase
VLWKAQETLKILPSDHRKALQEKIKLNDTELHHWGDISRKMRIVFQDDQLLSQFEGFETLAELDWDKYHQEYNDLQHIDVILAQAGDTPNRYKVLKQADVLMLFYLFSHSELQQLFERMGYSFPKEAVAKNIEYYAKRTVHGSTLSRVVHAWVLTREDRARSFDLFVEAFESDLSDTQGGTTPAGIHLGAMAGTVDIVQRCYTGLVVKDDILWFDPYLPDQVTRIAFTMHYRHFGLKIELNQEKLRITALSCMARNIQIGFDEKTYALAPGQELQFNLKT